MELADLVRALGKTQDLGFLLHYKEFAGSMVAFPECEIADFLICPTEPFKKGSVQTAKIVSAKKRHYVPVK